MSEAEWTLYCCDIPKAGAASFSKSDCAKLGKIYHVAHVPDACRIIADGAIKARLVGDESRLRKSRTSVSWFSANTWSDGSIYGTVQFTFLWEELFEGQRIYWVEAMKEYNPHAYRFLITERAIQKTTYCHPYDPATDKGPLRLRKGVSYWNGEFTSELMFDRDIPLSLCKEIRFIAHNRNLCRLHKNACRERLDAPDVIGARVMAYVLSHRPRQARRCLRREKPDGTAAPGWTVREAIETLWLELCEDNEFGGPIKSKARSRTVAQGALALYAAGWETEAVELASVLRSELELKSALEQLTADYFKINQFSLPD